MDCWTTGPGGDAQSLDGRQFDAAHAAHAVQGQGGLGGFAEVELARLHVERHVDGGGGQGHRENRETENGSRQEHQGRQGGSWRFQGVQGWCAASLHDSNMYLINCRASTQELLAVLARTTGMVYQSFSTGTGRPKNG
jgi:hypothetical protein